MMPFVPVSGDAEDYAHIYADLGRPTDLSLNFPGNSPDSRRGIAFPVILRENPVPAGWENDFACQTDVGTNLAAVTRTRQ